MKIARTLSCIGVYVFMVLLHVDREYREIRNKRLLIRTPPLKGEIFTSLRVFPFATLIIHVP